MSSALNFTASWNKLVSRVALSQGIWTIRLIALWPVAGVRVKQVHVCSGIAQKLTQGAAHEYSRDLKGRWADSEWKWRID